MKGLKSIPFLRKRVSYTPQMEVTECGAASLTMVLAYHGHHVSLTEVRQACGVSRDGANALAIVRAARGYALDAKGAKLGMEQLSQLPLPAILHWDFSHFVVLERLTKKKAFLVDPACGRRTMPLEEVSCHFTGVALIFSPTETFQRKPKTYPSLTKYKEIFKAYIFPIDKASTEEHLQYPALVLFRQYAIRLFRRYPAFSKKASPGRTIKNLLAVILKRIHLYAVKLRRVWVSL